MEYCDWIDTKWPSDGVLMKCQNISDYLIAIAYFSIPLELIYFVQKSAFSQYRFLLLQFGAFIVLCGATHFINLLTPSPHSNTVAIAMTVAKALCAVVSCVTALNLVHILPDLLRVKTREEFLKDKAEELNREMDLVMAQEVTERRVVMMSRRIRSTLNRDMILETALVELGRTLGLEECALWMPSRTGLTLELYRARNDRIRVGGFVPISLPVVGEVLSSARAMRIPSSCPLARIRPLAAAGRFVPTEVVAVRVPLRCFSGFRIDDLPDRSSKGYAIMVLILPKDSARQWRDHDLELVDVVADQISVALSHAAILEESKRSCDHLMAQNAALKFAQREAETAIHAHNYVAVMNNKMRAPMRTITTLSSLLLDTKLTPKQRVIMEKLLQSGNLLATLVNDVFDLSRLENGSLQLDLTTINIRRVFGEVINLIKPIATVKRLQLKLVLTLDLPVFAVGDEKRIKQTILQIVGNAVKFTKEGYISIIASVRRPESLRQLQTPEFFPVSSDGHFFLQVQVKDSGCGVSREDKPYLFTKFTQRRHGSSQTSTGGSGLGLAICKRFVNLMGGHIWIDSDGLDKGSTVTFIVKLGICDVKKKTK